MNAWEGDDRTVSEALPASTSTESVTVSLPSDTLRRRTYRPGAPGARHVVLVRVVSPKTPPVARQVILSGSLSGSLTSAVTRDSPPKRTELGDAFNDTIRGGRLPPPVGESPLQPAITV